MSRINRWDVEFPITDDKGHTQIWLARFQHQHDNEGVLFTDPQGKQQPVEVKHITRCRLSRKGQPIFITGVALCSLKDTYDWRRGLKQALQRALARAGFCEEITEKEGRIRIKDGKRLKRGSFLSLKPEYDQAMASFYRELPIKSYPPHNEQRLIIDDINQTPPMNQAGLHYAGSD